MRNIRLLTKNQLHNKVFVITFWLHVNQYWNCKISYSQVSSGRLTLISNDLVTSFRHFEYEHVLLDVQLQFQLIYNTHEKHEM